MSYSVRIYDQGEQFGERGCSSLDDVVTEINRLREEFGADHEIRVFDGDVEWSAVEWTS